jgi:N-acetylglucosamine-6-phosphate deacetylase
VYWFNRCLVDLQVNGIDDVDCATADGADWERLDRLLLAHGVTTWCPTLVTMPLVRYAEPLARIGAAIGRVVAERPAIAGVHLEGPFLGGALGAHPRDLIVDVALDWIDALPAHVAVVTLGAEQPLAAEATRALCSRGVLVSIGHSTADDDQLDRAFEHGAQMVTHLFNGMSGLHHRSPGVAAWALTHPVASASIIADGVHVHPRMLKLAMDTLGRHRGVLVTDSVAWRSGAIGSIGIQMSDGAPRLPDGTLAGSALTMDAALRTCVAAGVPLDVALTAASRNPARLLGLNDRGTIEIGGRADLVALSDDLAISQVWISGQPV